MRSVNMRQLRDTRQLKLWLKSGETVELRERDKVLAKIVPEEPAVKATVECPDFEARAKAICGNQVLTVVQDLIEDRENSRY